MKRVKGGIKIVAGQLDSGTYQGVENKIQLFDGKFTTGYRVVRFVITDSQPLGSYEAMATLSTEPKSTIGYWNFGDIQEIAWAGWQNPAPSNGSDDFTLVREGNMLIQDLWINAYSSSDNRVINYYIELEKYEFTAWDGAGEMVRNNAQAGPGT